MSSNGNPLVAQHNRASANISVYNYPEHLNPFYEKENHRRFRFWKFNTQNDCGAARKRSFSIDGFKGIWSFKSFRLRKKFSSLRINKTPESPPKLRQKDFNSKRDFNINDSFTCQIKPDFTQSKARNNLVRSSLHNMHAIESTNPDLIYGFNRNGRYRRTMQVTSACQKSLCLMTSAPIYCGSFSSQTVDIIKCSGLSQKSVMSTNPFDTDDDADILECTHPMNPSISKPERRKKRRAPLPPSSSEQPTIAKDISNTKSNSVDSNQPHQKHHTEKQTISALISEMEKDLPMLNNNSIATSKNLFKTKDLNALKIIEKFDQGKRNVNWDESCDKVKLEPQFSLKFCKSISLEDVVHAGIISHKYARLSWANKNSFNSEKDINLRSDETKALSKKMDLNEKVLYSKQLHPENNLSSSVLFFNPLKIIEPLQFNDRSFLTDKIFEKSQLTVSAIPISENDQTAGDKRSMYFQEIIESISKSQRLLNAPLETKNQNFRINRCKDVDSKFLFSLNNTYNNSEYSFKMLQGVSRTNYFYEHEQDNKRENQLETNGKRRTVCVVSPSHYLKNSQSQHCPKSVHQHEYKKFTSTGTNLDWNPVPKPKRTKDIAHETLNEDM